jgi:hypothetical protein
MSFSFMVSGHAGAGMKASDEDEGKAVQDIIRELLNGGTRANLNLTVHSVSPSHWAPERLNNQHHVEKKVE